MRARFTTKEESNDGFVAEGLERRDVGCELGIAVGDMSKQSRPQDAVPAGLRRGSAR